MKAAILLSTLVVGLIPATTQAQSRAPPDKPIYSRQGDAGIEEAIASARKTLPIFWARYRAAAPGYSAFQLKVGLPTDDGRGTEGLWMAVQRVDGAKIVGRLSNDPVAIKGLRAGAAVTVDSSRIEDWMYVKAGRAYGHYSTRALMKRATLEERAQTASFLAPTPLEPATH